MTLLQCRQTAGAKAFVFGLQLLEHIEAGTLLGLAMERAFDFFRDARQFLLNVAKPLLALMLPMFAGSVYLCVRYVRAGSSP